MKEESRREHNPVHASDDGALRKADQLAPLEEIVGTPARQSSGNGGVTDVDTGELKFPKNLAKDGKEKEWSFLGLGAMAFTILIFSLIFIAFITYLISIAEPKPPA